MGENESTTAKKKRRSPPPKPANWDQSKALDLAGRGVNHQDIASALHVHKNTIFRYLQRVKPELAQIQTFNDQTGSVLSLVLARCCSILDKLLVYYDDEHVIGGLTAAEKERLLGRVAITTGIIFDKLRLHEGKSTSNNSHELQLRQAHASLPFPTASSGE